MAIKKPVTKLKSTPVPAALPPKLLKKRPAPPAEEEEEEPAEEEEPVEEEETPRERRLRLKQEQEAAEEEEPAEEEEADEEEADEEEETPAPRRKGSAKKAKKKAKKSFADIFDATQPGKGLFPIGTWTANLISIELDGSIAEEDEEQSQLKVKVVYEGSADDEEIAGKKISQWHNIVDDEGEAAQGIGFLKADLDILGYEDVVLADLEEILEQISAEGPAVVIKVKENKGYTNVYLQGLADGE